MKKILLKAILFVVMLLMFSCNVVDRTVEKVFLRSYVMYYYDADDVELIEYTDEKVICILFTNPSPVGNYESTGAEKEAYDALCEKHNDINYNRDFVVWNSAGPKYTSCLSVDFTSIDIVSDADFDTDHPAGKSLSNIVTFQTSSLKPYIDNGYRSVANETYDHFSKAKGLLSDISLDNPLALLGHAHLTKSRITLLFETSPTLEKTHTFTVTMTPDDGREPFTASIEMTFE